MTTPSAKPLSVPTPIYEALEAGAALIISLSGGKDSQAMLNVLAATHQSHHWPGPLLAVHANLGRAEWPQTLDHCHRITSAVGVPLMVIRRTAGGDLVDRWKERMKQLRGTGKPFWSSAKQRYCTSDMKRNPINTFLRRYTRVISAEGVRADESPSRARRPIWEVRTAITTRTRTAYTWYPLHDWTIADIWDACGTTVEDLARRRTLYQTGHHDEAIHGWPAHPAYVFGNQRLSCALCILASRNDLINGARHNPALYRELVEMERESGSSFRSNLALSDLSLPSMPSAEGTR